MAQSLQRSPHPLYNPSESLHRLMPKYFLFIFLLALPCAAADSAAPQLLDSAHKLVDIRSDDSKPFQLEADFTALLDKPYAGHLTLRWSAKDLWQIDVTMDTFTLREVFKGDAVYITRNASSTPLRVVEMINLANVYEDKLHIWEARKVKYSTDNDVSKDCLQMHASHQDSYNRVLCIESTTHDILSDRTGNDKSFHINQFSDYRPFGAHRYPWHMQQIENGHTIVEIHVTSLQDATFDPSIFVPSASAIARRQCESMKHPEIRNHPDPRYPPAAQNAKFQGQSIVTITVEVDGSVSNPQLLQTAGRSDVDQAAIDAVKQWTFKPAMCGTDPVVTDINVDVNFRLY